MSCSGQCSQHSARLRLLADCARRDIGVHLHPSEMWQGSINMLLTIVRFPCPW